MDIMGWLGDLKGLVQPKQSYDSIIRSKGKEERERESMTPAVFIVLGRAGNSDGNNLTVVF